MKQLKTLLNFQAVMMKRKLNDLGLYCLGLESENGFRLL